MSKLKIYLDTSVISYLDQQDSPEKMAETHKLWDKIKVGEFDVVISSVEIQEINDCEENKRNKLIKYLDEINYTLVLLTEKTIEIASRIVELDILKQKDIDDCRHIAAAIVSGCNAFVSWSFRHIVNHKTMMGVKAVLPLKVIIIS
ncbi:hypothetical protein FACS1894164_13880 [Spirochaetia bacterium]|nr:hypothetical protein FACS1894164_13880 [Spirochaetia bacterium]